MHNKVVINKDIEILSKKLADKITRQLAEEYAIHEYATLVLSGGTSPSPLYTLLAKQPIDWNRVHLFWSDERFVSFDSPDSNYKMVKETLIDSADIPSKNIHPIQTHFPSKEKAAEAFEQQLKKMFHGILPVWDVNILGIGNDCHTASLFPHDKSLKEEKKWVIGVDRQKPPPEGITMTFPLLNSSKCIYVLASGEGKNSALNRILNSDESIDDCPAKGIRGNVEWWVDEAAAKELKG